MLRYATVRGKQGEPVPNGSGYQDVYVELAGGRWLVVSGAFPVPDLVRVADKMTIGPQLPLDRDALEAVLSLSA